MHCNSCCEGSTTSSRIFRVRSSFIKNKCNEEDCVRPEIRRFIQLTSELQVPINDRKMIMNGSHRRIYCGKWSYGIGSNKNEIFLVLAGDKKKDL